MDENKHQSGWALALGGGGARGIVHIGVLKILERHGLTPDLIVGTSVGAIFGGAYACLPDAGRLEARLGEVLDPDNRENRPLRRVSGINWSENTEPTLLNRLIRSMQKEIFVGMALFRNGYLSEEDLRNGVSAFLPDIDLADCRVPFAPLAVDLVSGQPWLPRRGPIVTAVMASCAMPGFMPPVSMGEALLMDGGLCEIIPVNAARRLDAAIVVGVDVGSQLDLSCQIQDGIDAINRATEVMSHHLGRAGHDRADLVLQPLDAPFDWTDYENYPELIRCGETAAEKALDDIVRLVC